MHAEPCEFRFFLTALSQCADDGMPHVRDIDDSEVDALATSGESSPPTPNQDAQ